MRTILFISVAFLSFLSGRGQTLDFGKEAKKLEEKLAKTADSVVSLRKELSALRDSLQAVRVKTPDELKKQLTAELTSQLDQAVSYDTILTTRDTIYSGVNEIQILQAQIKPGFLFKKKFFFPVVQGDTLSYTLTKQLPNKKVKYWTRQQGVKSKRMELSEKKEEQLIITQTSTDQYGFAFKRKGLKKNDVNLTINRLKKWTKTDQLTDTTFKAIPPAPPVIAYDTTTKLVTEQTYYVGSVRNIRAKDRVLVTLDFSDDPYLQASDGYMTFLIGFGKQFESEMQRLSANYALLPIAAKFGDPLTAFFANEFNGFPTSNPRKIKLQLKRGSQVIRRNFYNTTTGTIGRERTTYTLSIANPNEVAGEYVYVKVMAIDVTQKIIE
ncbi:MAG: hypothetical protein AAGA66_05220 [Bacteroidota bacterium]